MGHTQISFAPAGTDLIQLERLPRPTAPEVARPTGGTRLWMPRRVLFTPAALALPYGQQMRERVEALGLPIEELPANRLTGLRGDDERDTYRRGKTTLAVVVAPPSAMRLQPIPPSADWQFHIAEGCPAHCQYCYLAGSLSGPPVVRVFANLPDILANNAHYEKADGSCASAREPQSFEVSCYTDPLGIEHLTGGLSECIRWFGTRESATLRWVSKFDNVQPLLDLPHNGHTRCRISLNAESVARRFEGGVASIANRIVALRKLALPREQGGGAYPVGVVLAPIQPVDDWEAQYGTLLDNIAAALNFPCDLTFECISHRFTPGSKETLQSWYPNSTLEMDEGQRDQKRNKFGGVKYIYPKATMRDLEGFFRREIAARFPQAKVLYFT